MEFKIYDIEPVAKPRQTRSSKWKTTPREAKYYRFKDDIREGGVYLPESGYHVIFVLKMPLGWNYRKRDKMRHTSCQKTPDKDNMEKALLDSLFTQDSHIWDGRVSKVWGDSGKMIVITGIETDWIKIFLSIILSKNPELKDINPDLIKNFLEENLR
jgi:Holliday junction resolvase RusA-like endonuclease